MLVPVYMLIELGDADRGGFSFPRLIAGIYPCPVRPMQAPMFVLIERDDADSGGFWSRILIAGINGY